MEQRENPGFRNKDRYEKALEFIAAADSLPHEKFCRLAVRNSDALIEMLQGSRESLEFLASRQTDAKTIAVRIKEILHKLHFNPQDDYYLALLLPAGADQSEISRRWKELMLIYHPDKQPDHAILSPEYAAECSGRLNYIYNVLKDHLKKFSYDQHLVNPEGNGHERPSEFSNSGSSLLRNARKYSFALLFFFLLSAIIAWAVVYSGKNDIAHNPSQKTETPAQTDAKVQKPAAVAHNEIPVNPQQLQKTKAHPPAKHKAGRNHRRPAVRQAIAAAHHFASVKKQLVSKHKPANTAVKKSMQAAKPSDDAALADEVSDFIERLIQAYEDGDLNAYLSFYSTSATEDDGRTYGDLREFYGNLFDKGRYSYSITNMVIREENGTVMVTGNFVTKKLPEAARNPECKGTISLALTRECGELKILRAEKVLNGPS